MSLLRPSGFGGQAGISYQGSIMHIASKDNVLYRKACIFSIKAIKTYRYLVGNKEFILSKQFLRATTSIGANIAEANGAISDNDFSAKISIAYKESLETKYWLLLLKDSRYINQKDYTLLFKDTDELSKIMYSILKKTRLKNN